MNNNHLPSFSVPVKSIKEIMDIVLPENLHMSGTTGILADRISRHWLFGLRESDPSILTMFRDRDAMPYREHLSWSGEFAGKHITGAYYIYFLSRDEALYEDILSFIDDLISYQGEDGYLGCFPENSHITGAWDAWNHYHIMVGLYLWYSLTGREAWRTALLRMAELFIQKFYEDKPPLSSIGSTEMNLAPMHIFALLFQMTGEEKYLRFAKHIEKDLASGNAGNYIHTALEGIEFYQCPKPRWESMHVILGIAEMYLSTGDEYYLTAAAQITNSILKTDIHNTGAFSTNEQAIGNPYENRNVETCCVVAYNALAVRIFHMTGDSKLLDFLERSHYNAVMGYFSPSGKWSTYSTPMDGVKRANYDEIQFQSRAGSPQLNCCSVNAPRGVGEIAAWMFTKSDDRLFVNFYECFEADFGDMRISCQSSYPAPGEILLHIHGNGKKAALRIPGWSKQAMVTVNGIDAPASPGSWFAVDTDREDTEIVLHLDFTPYLEEGDGECKDKSSIFVGPVLYGADIGHNLAYDLRLLPTIHKSQLNTMPVPMTDGSIQWKVGDVTLCDFYHLGADGSAYRTWLDVKA